MSPAPSLETFADLYRRRSKAVIFAMHRFGVPVDLCEDAAQEAFLAVYRGLGRYDPALGSFDAWFWAIVFYTARSFMKPLYRRERPSLEPDRDDLPSTTPDPERQAMMAEGWEQIRSILSTLDDDKRIAFLMVRIENVPLRDAAKALAVPESTFASRLSKAEELLQSELSRRRLAEERKRKAAFLPLWTMDLNAFTEAAKADPPIASGAEERIWKGLVHKVGEDALLEPLQTKMRPRRTKLLQFANAAGLVGVGIVVGALGTYLLMPRSNKVSVVSMAPDTVPPSPAPSSFLSEEEADELSESPSPAPSGSVPESGLRAEIMLLDHARTALHQGNVDEAIHSVQKHFALYPESALRKARNDLLTQAHALRAHQKK